jgi:hypothetical protein
MGLGALTAMPPALALALAQEASPQAAPAEKAAFTLFDPTPRADLRALATDRPPKANSPYTVGAGHFQYETDLVVFGYGEAGGARTRDWTVADPTLKLGLTNTIDAELQLTAYQSDSTTAGGVTRRDLGWGTPICGSRSMYSVTTGARWRSRCCPM